MSLLLQWLEDTIGPLGEIQNRPGAFTKREGPEPLHVRVSKRGKNSTSLLTKLTPKPELGPLFLFALHHPDRPSCHVSAKEHGSGHEQGSTVLSRDQLAKKLETHLAQRTHRKMTPYASSQTLWGRQVGASSTSPSIKTLEKRMLVEAPQTHA